MVAFNNLRCFPRFAFWRCIRKCSQFVCRRPQLLRREVRVASHHLCGLPRAEFLQFRHRRAGHRVPRGPDMPPVVPTKVLDARALQRIAPRSRVPLTKRFALVGEHALGMLPLLVAQHRHRVVIQRHADHLAAPGFTNGCRRRTGKRRWGLRSRALQCVRRSPPHHHRMEMATTCRARLLSLLTVGALSFIRMTRRQEVIDDEVGYSIA